MVEVGLGIYILVSNTCMGVAKRGWCCQSVWSLVLHVLTPKGPGVF
jgi:hypothetical protein